MRPAEDGQAHRDNQRVAGGPSLHCTIPTEGAPSLRFLQEPALSLPKGWVAMLRSLFDFVVDTRSNPLGTGTSDSRPFDRLRGGSSQKTRRNGAPTVLNAANEVAVAAFLARSLHFLGIAALVEATLAAATKRGLVREPTTIEDAIVVDHDSRSLATELLPEIAAKAS